MSHHFEPHLPRFISKPASCCRRNWKRLGPYITQPSAEERVKCCRPLATLSAVWHVTVTRKAATRRHHQQYTDNPREKDDKRPGGAFIPTHPPSGIISENTREQKRGRPLQPPSLPKPVNEYYVFVLFSQVPFDCSIVFHCGFPPPLSNELLCL